jgi:NmrA-like family
MGTPFEDGTEGEIRRGKLMADITKENNIEHLVIVQLQMLIKIQVFLILKVSIKSSSILNLGIPYTIIGPTFFMENLLGPGLEQGQLALPLSSSSVLQQSALQNIAEFSALVFERRKPFLGKRIDIASDEVTGEQAARILSNVLGSKIRYVPVPLEQVYQTNEDMARMYDWYEKVGTGIDISALHQEYPEVGWLTFRDWAKYNKPGRPT